MLPLVVTHTRTRTRSGISTVINIADMIGLGTAIGGVVISSLTISDIIRVVMRVTVSDIRVLL